MILTITAATSLVWLHSSTSRATQPQTLSPKPKVITKPHKLQSSPMFWLGTGPFTITSTVLKFYPQGRTPSLNSEPETLKVSPICPQPCAAMKQWEFLKRVHEPRSINSLQGSIFKKKKKRKSPSITCTSTLNPQRYTPRRGITTTLNTQYRVCGLGVVTTVLKAMRRLSFIPKPSTPNPKP